MAELDRAGKDPIFSVSKLSGLLPRFQNLQQVISTGHFAGFNLANLQLRCLLGV